MVGQTIGASEIEVVVVNDGGESPAQLLRGQELRAALIETPGTGQVPARALALQAARAERIALLDDDDTWEPDHLERLLAALGDGRGLVCSWGSLDLYRSGDLVERRSFHPEFHPGLLRRTNPILASSVVYRRSLHDQLGGFDPALPYYWDWDWYLRVQSCARITMLPRQTVRVRVNLDGGNTSDPGNPAIAANLALLCRKHDLGTLPVHNFLSALDQGSLWSAGGEP